MRRLARDALRSRATSDDSIEAAVDQVLRRSGHNDELVNNAGVGVGLGGDEESSIAQTKALFETNFFGTVPMTRAVVAETVLAAANTRRPKLRYPVGSVATVQLLRRLLPGLVDAGIRRDLKLDAHGGT